MYAASKYCVGYRICLKYTKFVYGLDGRGIEVLVPVRARCFSFTLRLDRLWGTPSLLFIKYLGLLPRG
jgi:hypothetical protein